MTTQLPLFPLSEAPADLTPLATYALHHGPASPALLRAAWGWTPDDEEIDDEKHGR